MKKDFFYAASQFDVDQRGFSKTAVVSNNYVVPQKDASKYYDGDYILNVYNYGIIFGNEIHWYEIGIGTPVLHTPVDARIYEVVSEKHGWLIRTLNQLGYDLINERFRSDPTNYSKKAQKDEEERIRLANEQEDQRFRAEMDALKILLENDEFKKQFSNPDMDEMALKMLDAEVEKNLVRKKNEA